MLPCIVTTKYPGRVLNYTGNYTATDAQSTYSGVQSYLNGPPFPDPPLPPPPTTTCQSLRLMPNYAGSIKRITSCLVTHAAAKLCECKQRLSRRRV